MPRKYTPNSLKQIDPTKQTILSLLAISYGPMNRADILTALRQLGLRSESGKMLTHLHLKPEIDSMLDDELLEFVDRGVACPRTLTNGLCEAILGEGRFDILAEAAGVGLSDDPQPRGYSWAYVSFDRFLGFLRSAVYQNHIDRLEKLLRWGRDYYEEQHLFQELVDSMDSGDYDRAWFKRLPYGLRMDFIMDRLWIAAFRLGPIDHLIAPLKREIHENGLTAPGLLIDVMLMRGETTKAIAEIRNRTDPENAVRLAWAKMVDGEWDAAREANESAYALLTKSTRKRNIYFKGIAGVFVAIAQMNDADAEQAQALQARLERGMKQEDNPFQYFFHILSASIKNLQGKTPKHDAPSETRLDHGSSGIEWLLTALSMQWNGKLDGGKYLKKMNAMESRAKTNGYGWIERELRQFVLRLAGEPGPHPARHMVDAVRPMQDWERALQALTLVGHKPAARKAANTQASRLIWLVDFDDYDGLRVQPRKQKSTAKGGWTKGQSVSFKRLSENRSEMDFLSDQDTAICMHIKHESSYQYYGSRKTEYYLKMTAALPSVVGHPLLFLADAPTTPVEIVAGNPVLEIAVKGEQLEMSLSPLIYPEEDVLVERHSPTRFAITKVDEPLKRIARIIGTGLSMPKEAEAGIREAMANIAPIITVQSEVTGVPTGVEECEADSKPYLHILPAGEGLSFELFSHPFGMEGPGFGPGLGGKSVYTEIEGARLHALRRLEDEDANAEKFVQECPSLATCQTGQFCWESFEAEHSLEILAECKVMDADKVSLIWPRGETIRVRAQSSTSDMSLRIRQQGDWFEADGELVVDDKLTLGLGQLLELSRDSGGKFLKLGDGEYLALTKRLKSHLDDLRDLSSGKSNGARFHHLTVETIDDIGGDLGTFVKDNAWNKQLEKLKQARLHVPVVPSTLTAELRDYQQDGFRWLAQLAAWGAGGCLADDMGLGKTVQALALMLTRAPDGPCLVIAPTSVCANWVDECARFAPTLNPLVYGGKNREAMIENSGPFDVIIASYGMLQHANQCLDDKRWQVLVLDEAQAVKNPGTKRARAAIKLTAEFRIALTGTPIENHLGELWSLFNFLNPGLLGSRESFNRKFAGPIEANQDQAARNRLRSLVKPFILRRLKAQVLKELPPRTDIVLHVELGKEETALYESVREAAVKRLAEGETEGQQQRFQVLAEITRLRLACCNPNLIAPQLGLSSAKLDVFLGIVDELLDNRHKALVFSQFVKHLSLVREALDQSGISYQYLDGSTPAKKRAAIVKAFQAGEGDLFLISLKAGGTGLNLTAADYVIHLDPWWNPAVEDQASDRAHRIGQQRPVTIYRLVAKGTIEDKIVELHQHKRDLANDLLEGTHDSSRLSSDDILALLKGG